MEFTKFIIPKYEGASASRLIGRPSISQSGFIDSSIDEDIYASEAYKNTLDTLKDTKSTTTLSPKKEIKQEKGKTKNFDVNEGHESLGKNSSVKVGAATITVTDPYGLRSFKGREGEHSRGMDIKTSTGKAHALQDGEIVEVKLQGNGKVITPSQGKAGGYYIVIKNSDGSHTQMMHLDPMSDTDMKNLKGKKIKRGDEIWGYTTGSGSMTGPHIKVRHYGDNSQFNIDPSQLLKGEAYSFIPDSKGENMLKFVLGGRILLR